MHILLKKTNRKVPWALTTFSARFLIYCCFFSSVVFAHPGHHAHEAKTALPDTLARSTPHTLGSNENSGAMGIDEKLGSKVPLDLKFATETGDSVQLGDLVKGPTILSFLYYGCSNACGTLLMGVATVLRSFADKPVFAPNVIFISISDQETPAIAMKTHTIAFESIQKPYPAQRWHFLTGSAQNIKQVTDAVGFRFVKKGDDYDHPMGLIVLSPSGKVMRYINGTDFLPMDISISLLEAAQGAVQPSIARVLRYCFSFDPKSHAFVFNILRVSATVIFSLLGIFIAYLIYSTRKRRDQGAGS
jgi:protein SCO1/2